MPPKQKEIQPNEIADAVWALASAPTPRITQKGIAAVKTIEAIDADETTLALRHLRYAFPGLPEDTTSSALDLLIQRLEETPDSVSCPK